MRQRYVDAEGISVDTDLIAKKNIYYKEAVECPSGTGPPEGALEAHKSISRVAAPASSHIEDIWSWPL